MSLILSNRLTDKQRAMLQRLEYYGTYDLTTEQAAHLIDELLEQQRQEQEIDESLYNHDYIEFNGQYYDIF